LKKERALTRIGKGYKERDGKKRATKKKKGGPLVFCTDESLKTPN